MPCTESHSGNARISFSRRLNLIKSPRLLLLLLIPIVLAGLLNRGGNLLLLIGLEELDASLQYPLVTGGTILVSAAISFLSRERFTLRSLAAIVFALAATVVILL